ncbi:MAG: GAF domain-containing protein, partial [Planctomycetes bacterium]|nr:GAF domain-containing protein [Planctomycetota bacterium]
DAQKRAVEAGLRSWRFTPLISRGEVIGTLNFRSRQDNAYGENEIRIAELIGAQIAGAIATSQLHRLSEREGEIRKGLAAIAAAAASDLQLDQILDGVRFGNVKDRLAGLPCKLLVLTLSHLDESRYIPRFLQFRNARMFST